MLDRSVKKVLLIGSGPIVIGQAAEFDYAGTQACKIIKGEGIELVLVNSNPATIMTDRSMADKIYLEPLTERTLERIIEREKPDSLLAGLGGQTGLTLAMELDRSGFLKEHGVRVLGTSVASIDLAEDRQLFKKTMERIGVPTIASDTAESVEEALETAERIGYPVIIRPAFTLGGGGGGVAGSRGEMESAARTGLEASPIHQILVEKYIVGWEEIEFEAVRDASGKAITVCSMENIDPVGVHTGDSVVVAPALTLPAPDLEMLRQASLRIVDALDIRGGCNCQFAYDPETSDYYVIEVNPRVSRSSALASKATGYPIAKVTTLIALGYLLEEIRFDPAAEVSRKLRYAMGNGEYYFIDGNHEYLQSKTYSDNFYAHREYMTKAVYGDALRTYYYVDNPATKMRYIILSTYGEWSGGSENPRLDDADQLAWFTNTALNVEDGWTVIVFAHIFSTYTGTFVAGTTSLISAMASMAHGEVACIIQGDQHHDYTLTVNNGAIPVVCTTCDKNIPVSYSTPDMEDSDVRKTGTIKEQAFDVVVVDKTNKNVHFVRIGYAKTDNETRTVHYGGD